MEVFVIALVASFALAGFWFLTEPETSARSFARVFLRASVLTAFVVGVSSATIGAGAPTVDAGFGRDVLANLLGSLGGVGVAVAVAYLAWRREVERRATQQREERARLRLVVVQGVQLNLVELLRARCLLHTSGKTPSIRLVTGHFQAALSMAGAFLGGPEDALGGGEAARERYGRVISAAHMAQHLNRRLDFVEQLEGGGRHDMSPYIDELMRLAEQLDQGLVVILMLFDAHAEIREVENGPHGELARKAGVRRSWLAAEEPAA